MKLVGWVLLSLIGGFIGYLIYIQTRPIKFVIREDIITISGDSMAPTLTHGSQYQVNLCKQGLCNYKFKRGDSIVYKQAPIDEEFIKRIIGLPTEKITITQGNVYINDQLLTEPYLASASSTILKDNQTCISYTLKENEYFLLGDNRLESRDSREDGPIRHDSILSYLTYPTTNPTNNHPKLWPSTPPPCTKTN